MVQPINYMAMMPQIDLAQSLGQGLQAGMLFRKNQQEMQAAEQAKVAKEQYRTDLQNALQNPTQATWAAMIAKYPGQREAFAKSAEMYGKDKVQAEFNQGIEISNALESNKPEIAQARLEEIVAARKNSGLQPGMFGQILDQLKAGNIKGAQGATNFALSAIDPENFEKASKARVSAGTVSAEIAKPFAEVEKLGAETVKTRAETTKTVQETALAPQRLALEAQQTAAELRDIESKIQERSARLGLDRDRLQSEVETKLYEWQQKNGTLEPDARKIVNESAVASVTASQAAGQMEDLASRLEKQGGGYGAAAKASEWLKDATGSQDYMSELRKEYVRVRNSQAIKMLPPGPATDKDIELAMRGFPSETADSQTLAAFLRGMAKLNNVAAATETAKAEWVNSVGSLGRSKRDVVVDGITVPAGMSFADFAKNYVGQKTKQAEVQTQQQALPNRSYMRWSKQSTAAPGQIGSGTFGQ